MSTVRLVFVETYGQFEIGVEHRNLYSTCQDRRLESGYNSSRTSEYHMSW